MGWCKCWVEFKSAFQAFDCLLRLAPQRLKPAQKIEQKSVPGMNKAQFLRHVERIKQAARAVKCQKVFLLLG